MGKALPRSDGAGLGSAGRINSAAGTSLTATLINCFVQPVGDSITETLDGKPGIYTALAEAAETMRRGGGVGYDFSSIRPEGALVRGTNSRASGPVSYMRVFDQSCETVEVAGARRGAQMGVLRCDHPDIERFIHAKDEGDLANFNISVGVTDAFMEAVESDGQVELVHKAGARARYEGGGRLSTGLMACGFIARCGRASCGNRSCGRRMTMREPGVLFLDKVNRDNNLNYCETLEASNPCAEEFLPSYGCCCLGSIDLTRFVRDPFTESAQFDFDSFGKAVSVSVRMLDNVLDVTPWPLKQQDEESRAKRRVGLGFTGLGDALAMLCLRYDTQLARDAAAGITQFMRDRAYDTSIDLARERGAFPMFNKDLYLSGGNFASRLPSGNPGSGSAGMGFANSHLLAIAPTGTISLAFADNASNGIEPPFSWTYMRKKRMADGTHKQFRVEDHAWRLYRHMFGEDAKLPDYFVTALEISAQAHQAMVAAVAPFVDTSISKTVNVAEDYPYPLFETLYLEAWKSGLKGLATYRPNSVLGAVLTPDAPKEPAPLTVGGTNRRLEITKLPVLTSLRWKPGRPEMPQGNLAWTYMVESPFGRFAIFVGQVEEAGRAFPFEVWVNGAEQPRGLGAVAKTLLDGHARRRSRVAAQVRSSTCSPIRWAMTHSRCRSPRMANDAKSPGWSRPWRRSCAIAASS